MTTKTTTMKKKMNPLVENHIWLNVHTSEEKDDDVEIIRSAVIEESIDLLGSPTAPPAKLYAVGLTPLLTHASASLLTAAAQVYTSGLINVNHIKQPKLEELTTIYIANISLTPEKKPLLPHQGGRRRRRNLMIHGDRGVDRSQRFTHHPSHQTLAMGLTPLLTYASTSFSMAAARSYTGGLIGVNHIMQPNVEKLTTLYIANVLSTPKKKAMPTSPPPIVTAAKKKPYLSSNSKTEEKDGYIPQY